MLNLADIQHAIDRIRPLLPDFHMSQTTMTGNDETAELQRAAATLQAGGLVAIPTETVYGLAANALNAQAVAKIFAAKERPFFDPLIVKAGAVSRQRSQSMHC